MSRSNEEIVAEFIRAWSDLDAGKLVEWFTEDGCYHNMPLAPVVGHTALRAFIEGFLSTWVETKWEIRTLLCAGDTVMVERVDRTRATTGSVDLPCVGVFEMAGGKIREWRDYFDLATYMNAMSS